MEVEPFIMAEKENSHQKIEKKNSAGPITVSIY